MATRPLAPSIDPARGGAAGDPHPDAKGACLEACPLRCAQGDASSGACSDLERHRPPSRDRRFRPFDPHAVERPVDEEHRHHQEDRGEHVRESRALLLGERHGQLHRQQAEQRGELDDRVERHRASCP